MEKLTPDQIIELIKKMDTSQANYQALIGCWIASQGTASKDSCVDHLVKFGKNKAGESKDAKYHANGNPVFKVMRSKFMISETGKGKSKVFKINADLSSEHIEEIRRICHEKLN